MILQRTLDLYMKYCHSRQLRPKTMISYEQTLKLFFAWLEEKEGITQVEAIKDKHIRDYIKNHAEIVTFNSKVAYNRVLLGTLLQFFGIYFYIV